MQRVTTLKKTDYYFILRDVAFKLILTLEEHTEIYIYTIKNTKEIIYISLIKDNLFLNKNKIDYYKTTLKKLYISLIVNSYPNLPKESLIILSNRLLRRINQDTVAKMLGITLKEYDYLENGIVTNFDYKKTAYALNFEVEEFYYDFNTLFEEIN